MPLHPLPRSINKKTKMQALGYATFLKSTIYNIQYTEQSGTGMVSSERRERETKISRAPEGHTHGLPGCMVTYSGLTVMAES